MLTHGSDRSVPAPVSLPGSDVLLADLVTGWAGASAVLQQHGLDFCCRGQRSLAEACREQRLDLAAVQGALHQALQPVAAGQDWRQRGNDELVRFLVDHFHAWHRRELPRLGSMASKVETVHADRADCPRGLANFLAGVTDRLELHMQKEEQVLFPMLLAGSSAAAEGPLQMLTAEHDEHGRDLAALRGLAHDYVPPAGACATWRALYADLAAFERAVMEHIHLENHVLFPRGVAR
ncbi:MAG: iron-sulfur cluster repair di-iron protein [Planctomycetes bacterium]|nr:iron-sulfur cluster repair di-iron protein [Planctomycetota bacterium]MCC7397102.1 iron-sulfur cluster repair di-iron protein [Planctomycetota bacterium]